MRLAVFASGEGTIFQSIARHVELGVLRGVELSLLICNRPNSKVLERSKELRVKSLIITTRRVDGSKKDRREFEEEILEALREHGIEFIFLAGWDKILDVVVDEYPYRIMNSHPSLLPAFAGLYGIEVHKAVINRGCKVSGCTIHYVDKGVDTGPIILQRVVEVSDEETPESLAEKVKGVERLLAPMAIQLHVDGRISLIRRGEGLVAKVDYSRGWIEEWNSRQERYIRAGEGSFGGN